MSSPSEILNKIVKLYDSTKCGLMGLVEGPHESDMTQEVTRFIHTSSGIITLPRNADLVHNIFFEPFSKIYEPQDVSIKILIGSFVLCDKKLTLTNNDKILIYDSIIPMIALKSD